jgi:hypothetical protein
MTAAMLKAELENLLTIGTVTVTYSSGTTLCAATQVNAVSVTFLTELGGAPWPDSTTLESVPKVPNMTPGSISGSLTLSMGYTAAFTIGLVTHTNTPGTMENHICSDRGICTPTTGLCVCFPGFGSSDGNKGEGKRGDCGYVEPYLTFTG